MFSDPPDQIQCPEQALFGFAFCFSFFHKSLTVQAGLKVIMSLKLALNS